MDKPQVVTVRGLRKAYGNRVVVDGLDLDVPAGEIVGLIGANGAGKTTTVECIQGLRKPDAGILRVLGYDPVTQAGELRPLIGSQLQDSALPDRLRVAEAVALFGTARTRDGGELLEQFGLAQRRRSAFGSLSGGERQRLFLVLALLDQIRRLDGVHDVERAGTRITVRGARSVIAHVGAALVRWGPVPADLSVHVPTLEDALLGLLDGADVGDEVAEDRELVGGRK